MRLNQQMAANNNFVYLGGEQEVPFGVTHAIIDPSVTIVRRRAFYKRRRLVSVIFHDGVEIIEREAFYECEYLGGRIKLLGVREIRQRAFDGCFNLSDVEFGDRLETIGELAFGVCYFRSIKMPSVRTTEDFAFAHCTQLTEVEFGIDLERIGPNSFANCPQLQRVAIPLKDNLFPLDTREHRYMQFDGCGNLTMVELVGAEGIHKTISSLLMESWRDEMNQEIDRINQELPNNHASFTKANRIQQWIRTVIDRMEHYKAEHNRLLREHMAQLELAIWKAKLEEEDEDEEVDDSTLQVQTKRAKIDVGNAREEKRITSGADIIIKNVLPFLKLG